MLDNKYLSYYEIVGPIYTEDGSTIPVYEILSYLEILGIMSMHPLVDRISDPITEFIVVHWASKLED